MEKKAVSRIGISDTAKQSFEKLPSHAKIRHRGIHGDKSVEAIPEFISTPSEKVIKNDNNAWIVLGRDRSEGRETGYGGIGDTQCASIDIVTGRMGHQPIAKTKNNETMFVDPNFKKDSARIYISQKTDIDKNFGLVKGNVGVANTRSAIALKADGIRLIGREGIKLITGGDLRNSQGADIISISGIDLIANNDDSDLQPLVKGHNLVKALERTADLMKELNGIVDSFLHTQMKMNAAVMSHYHLTYFGGTPTSPSPTTLPVGMRVLKDQLIKVERSILSNSYNLTGFKNNFCTNERKNYICSRYNNTT
jgi:hypothetical protein